ncbi:hypothetical protein OJAV_G00080900 [Oryzias javanicus]|uniref:Uncharacterized protein n=1 Tax=Oryzias javanicus TaxID=123683 RepID=A0A437D4L8_ORYJA|nr:hypothetical protein OJAV_G00080900 [Oryzias javanicus]
MLSPKLLTLVLVVQPGRLLLGMKKRALEWASGTVSEGKFSLEKQLKTLLRGNCRKKVASRWTFCTK